MTHTLHYQHDFEFYYPYNKHVENIKVLYARDSVCFKFAVDGEAIMAMRLISLENEIKVSEAVLIFDRYRRFLKSKESEPIFGSPMDSGSLDAFEVICEAPVATLISNVTVKNRYNPSNNPIQVTVPQVVIRVDSKWYNKVKSPSIEFTPRCVNTIV